MTTSAGVLLGLALLGAPDGVFVSVDEALVLTRTAVVVDARGDDAEAPFLPGAIPLDWTDFKDGIGRTGRLAEPAEIAKALGALGISRDAPVLVYGKMGRGWGEEGRIWWMLRYLGVRSVTILDGGIKAWVAAKKPVKRAASTRTPTTFVPALEKELRVDHARVLEGSGEQSVVVLDVRTEKEFVGATPYWSSRGGHIPNARHLHWTDLVAPNGKLHSRSWIRARARSLGMSPETPVITYCTGGVRSAFVQAALVHAGFSHVANYDGSWWDWSARRHLPAAK